MTKREEVFPEVDKRGNFIGIVPRKAAHKNKKRIHPAVRIFVLDPNSGKTLLQFRADKDLDPYCWDYGGGGHPIIIEKNKPETYRQAAIRELEEEIKLKPETYRLKRIPGHELDDSDLSQTEWVTWFIAEVPENNMPPLDTKTEEVRNLALVDLRDLINLAEGKVSVNIPLKKEKIRSILLKDLKRPKIKTALKAYLQ